MNSIVARIYVGLPKAGLNLSLDQNDAETVSRILMKNGIDGATIYPAVGLWKGELEHSIVVEIVGPGLVIRVAEALALAFGQTCVLLVRGECEYSLVDGK